MVSLLFPESCFCECGLHLLALDAKDRGNWRDDPSGDSGGEDVISRQESLNKLRSADQPSTAAPQEQTREELTRDQHHVEWVILSKKDKKKKKRAPVEEEPEATDL